MGLLRGLWEDCGGGYEGGLRLLWELWGWSEGAERDLGFFGRI